MGFLRFKHMLPAAAIALLASCSTKVRVDAQSTSDSLANAAAHDSAAGMTTAPTVQTLPAPAGSTQNADQSSTQPSDSSHGRTNTTAMGMPGQSPVQFKYVAKAVTSMPSVTFYVMALDRLDSGLAINGLLQNGQVTANEGVKPVTVKLTKDQLRNAKLIDDKSGKTYSIAATTAATSDKSIKLNPAATESINLSFVGVPQTVESITLVIPGFVKIPSVIVRH